MKGALLKIGAIGRAHGVRGEVTFSIRPSEFDGLPELFWAAGEPVQIRSQRALGNSKFVLTIEGVSNRDDAEKLTGTEVFIRREQRAAGLPGEWSARDLVGLSVEGMAGESLGVVTGLLPTPGVAVLEIEGAGGEWMLPATEPLIVEVDFEGNRLIVDPPKGLVPGTEEE